MGFAWLEDIIYIASGESLADSLLTAALRLIMAPFAHSLFTDDVRHRGLLRAAPRSALGKVGCILVGYLGAVVMHGMWNGSSLCIEAYFLVYVLWMVPIFGLAICWRPQPAQGAAVVAAKLPGMVTAGLVTAERGDLAGLDPDPQAGDRRGDPARRKAAGQGGQEVRRPGRRLAFVRDRIDRGFGDARVDALHRRGVRGIRGPAAAPALQGRWIAHRSTSGGRSRN